MHIFLVAVVSHEPPRKRTWGWYEKFGEAERAVLENHTDIFERGYYDFAVIEEMPERVLAVAEKEWWYQATYDRGATEPNVEPIPKPAVFGENFNFTMG